LRNKITTPRIDISMVLRRSRKRRRMHLRDGLKRVSMRRISGLLSIAAEVGTELLR
jgi:hypothetical protein